MPYNFSFVIPKLLAGMACPGSLQPLEQDILELQKAGIEAIVSLTEYALPSSIIKKSGLDYIHIPIPDFATPTIEQIETFTNYVAKHHRNNQGVAVHCAAGIGRTGTMLACYLVYRGATSEHAISTIRKLRQGSIETADQENIIHYYYKESTNHA